jgi:bacterioferritin
MAVAWTVKSPWFAVDSAGLCFDFIRAMHADPRTLGWLTSALNHELSAVQQYQAQSALARLWGETALADLLPARGGRRVEPCTAEMLMAHLITDWRCSECWQPRSGQVRSNAGAVVVGQSANGAGSCSSCTKKLLVHAHRVRDSDCAALMQSLLDEEREFTSTEGQPLHCGAYTSHV